jgi:hypothetical protein
MATEVDKFTFENALNTFETENSFWSKRKTSPIHEHTRTPNAYICEKRTIFPLLCIQLLKSYHTTRQRFWPSGIGP